MRYAKGLMVALAGVAALSGAAHAASPPASATPTAAQQTDAEAAVLDSIKMSDAAAVAFRDIGQTRFAIYSADSNAAKMKLDEAVASLDKAKDDSAAFIKAASELTPPKGVPAKETPASTEQVKWLPFGGQLTLSEDFVATPDKTKAVQTANQHFAKGEKKEALDALKVADVDVTYTYALAPLDATMSGIAQAKTLMDQDKYYEANAELKKIEDAVRFDSVSAVGTPAKTSAN